MVSMTQMQVNNIYTNQKTSFFRRLIFIFLIIILVIFLVFSLIIWRAKATLSEIFLGKDLVIFNNETIDDPNRVNILILGLRGEDDPDGGLLTDTIMILSVKKDTEQTALFSFPRDFYLELPIVNKWEKVNSAYALGEEKYFGGGGIIYSKAALSRITNLYLDYTIAVDFTAFKEIINALGGEIIIELDKPFSETAQFAQEMIIDLPAGKNVLDSRTALYYVRSRFSTSDFDRARRQQDVLIAIKNKAFSLGVLSNPIKIFNLLEVMGRHIKSDIEINDVKDLINLYTRSDIQNIKQIVFDASPQGLLYESRNEAGAYILLPKGDNFEQIQKTFIEVFN